MYDTVLGSGFVNYSNRTSIKKKRKKTLLNKWKILLRKCAWRGTKDALAKEVVRGSA